MYLGNLGVGTGTEVGGPLQAHMKDPSLPPR